MLNAAVNSATEVNEVTYGYKIGTSYLMHLVPAWELVGCLMAIHRDQHGDPVTLEFDECAYIESVPSGVHRLAAATTPAALKKAVSTVHPIPDGMIVAAHLVTHATPMSCPSRILARAEQGEAVKQAGGK